MQKNKNKKATATSKKVRTYHWYVVLAYFVISSAAAWIFLAIMANSYFKPIVWAFNNDKLVLLDKEAGADESEVVVEDTDGLVPRKIDGVLVAPENANAFPVAVMIDNIPPAWPHSGLEAASVLYETLVEGGATRIMAVFAGGTADKIGPIRSARPYYLEWVSEYDAFYGHVGGSPEALAAIDGLGLKDFSQLYNGQYFWRDTSRYAPHNVYTSSELINLALRDKEYSDLTPDYESWKHKDDTPAEERNDTEKTVEVKFSGGETWTSKYVYDFDSNNYQKFHAGIPHVDNETGNQLAAKNVIVVVVPQITQYGEKGRLTMDIAGEGRAFVFRDGEKIEGIWKKADREDRTRFYDNNDEEIHLNRGTTWVSVIPEDREVLYHESE